MKLTTQKLKELILEELNEMESHKDSEVSTEQMASDQKALLEMRNKLKEMMTRYPRSSYGANSFIDVAQGYVFEAADIIGNYLEEAGEMNPMNRRDPVG